MSFHLCGGNKRKSNSYIQPRLLFPSTGNSINSLATRSQVTFTDCTELLRVRNYCQWRFPLLVVIRRLNFMIVMRYYTLIRVTGFRAHYWEWGVIQYSHSKWSQLNKIVSVICDISNIWFCFSSKPYVSSLMSCITLYFPKFS